MGLMLAVVIAPVAVHAAEVLDLSAPHPRDNPESGLMLDLPDTGMDVEAIDFDRLPQLDGDHAVISRGDPQWQFRLHSYLGWHDGQFWCMWSHGPRVEDHPTQHVRYSTSSNGLTWSEPQIVIGPSRHEEFRYIARGFWQRDGELLALASHDEAYTAGRRRYFGRSLALHGFRWNSDKGRWEPLGILADDTINNFPPKRLSTGPWMMSRRGHDYKSDPQERSWLIGGIKSIREWSNATIPVAANDAQLEEPNFYELPGGSLVSLYRDNSQSKRLYRAFSNDRGKSWSRPVPTNFPDARSKFSDLRTSRGYYVLVSNANPTGRNPLCLAVSRNGLVFTALAALAIPAEDDETLQYPHVIEHGDDVWIAFSRNKTAIEVLRVPLAAVDALVDNAADIR
jgi:hypothetical protein